MKNLLKSLILSDLSEMSQLVATAVASGIAVATIIFGYQALEREERLFTLKNSIPPASDGNSYTNQLDRFGTSNESTAEDKEDARNLALAQRAQAGDFDEELILEQLARNRVFLTPEGLEKLRKAFVIVVGCGGVGSHCVASLARSGVSKMRLIDFDQVTLSSLNRHAVATLADVGTPKVQCLRRRLMAITPWAQFDLRAQKFDADVAAEMLGPWQDGQEPDFIVDAIDNIDTKVALLRHCHDKKLAVISSMGAGCKGDPTKVMVGDIGSSTDDGLSRATRRRLKLAGITSGIPVIYSTEQSGAGKAELQPLDAAEVARGAVGELGVMADFRVRILPVLGTMPAIFGLTAANHVVLRVTGYPVDYAAGKGRDKMYDGIVGQVQSAEERLARTFEPGLVGLRSPVTAGDVAFLTEELYGGRSAVTGLSARLALVRWRRPERMNVSVIDAGGGIETTTTTTTTTTQKCSTIRLRDLVCMTRDEAARHERLVFEAGRRVEDVYDAGTIERIERKMAQAAEYEKFRW